MNLLALDLSTKASGWCVKSNGKMEYGCVTSSSQDVMKRIEKMRDEIIPLIKEHNIDTLIYEEVRPVPNSNTTKKLTWLQAIIIFEARKANPAITLEEMQPSEWRSKVGIKTGRGIKREELKKKDIEYANAKYNLNLTSDDIADAIGLADAYLQQNESAF